MDKRELFYGAVLLVGVLISAISQVMLKKAAMKTYASPVREYLNPLALRVIIRMNPAASDNQHVRVFPNKEIIVNQVINPALRHTGRNIHHFVFGSGKNGNI